MTQSTSLSLEDTTTECVELSEHINTVDRMHSRSMTIDKLLQLMVPMSVGLVSHTVVHDNTSVHLHVVVHGED